MKRHISVRLCRNIRVAYARASTYDKQVGHGWYANARCIARAMGERHGIQTDAVCGIIAALSPGRNWDMNLEDAELFCSEWSNGARGRRLPIVGSYGMRNIIKAAKIAAGNDPLAVLGGNKVRAFYSCITNPAEQHIVCIDRHAKAALYGKPLGDKKGIVTPSEYDWLAAHYRAEAARAGILPHQYQAVVWVVWRRLKGVLDQNDLPF